jgi:nucleotide-binding universal stress UspA family protein
LPLFKRVLVPVNDLATQEKLLGLAALLAKANHGKVFAVSVAKDIGEQEKSLVAVNDVLGRVHHVMGDPQTEIDLIPRLAATEAQGILHTSFEENATIILLGWRGKRSLRESLLGSVLDEVIWGSDTPVIVGKLSVPLNGTKRVMLEANLLLAKSLNVPLSIWADSSYRKSIDSLLTRHDTDHSVTVEPLTDQLKPAALDEESISSFIVVPGFGSRKRVADTLGNLPEQMAASFDGNLAILHFDK